MTDHPSQLSLRKAGRRHSFSSMMIDQSIGSLDKGTGLMTELEQLGLVPVEAPGSRPGRALDSLLKPEPPNNNNQSPLPSNLASLLQPSPPANVKKGHQRRRSYDNIVKEAFKRRSYDEGDNAPSLETGEYAFSLHDTMKEPEPPKSEGRSVNPHIRPGVVLTVAEEELHKQRGTGGRKSFKQAMFERDAALSVPNQQVPTAPKVRRSFAGVTKAGLAKTRLVRLSSSKAPRETEGAVSITDPAIRQSLRTRDKQRGAQERRKSLDEKRRASLSSVNELKKRRIFENLTKESQSIRQSDQRLAPVKAWLMCMALYKRHEEFKRKFSRHREVKLRKDAAARIQKGWRTRPKGKKYATLIAVIKKHRSQTLHKVVVKRRHRAGTFLQRLLTHAYRNKRFVGWGAVIRDRTAKAQKAFRSFLLCTEFRIRAMILLWDRAMKSKEGRKKMELMRMEFVGETADTINEAVLKKLMREWTRSWLRAKRLEFVTSENATFLDATVSSRASVMLPVYSLHDAKALLNSDAQPVAPTPSIEKGEAKFEYGIKMRPRKGPRRVWRNLTIFSQGADYTTYIISKYRENLALEQASKEASSPPMKEKSPEKTTLSAAEQEGHRIKFGLGYSIA